MKKFQQSMPFRPGDRLFIKAHATLDVEGWDKPEVWIETDLNVQRIQHESDGLHLLFVDDAMIKVPCQALLVIEKASGNGRVRNVTSDVEIHSLDGNLAVQQANRVKIDRVNGSCLVQDIAGRLEIHSVGGNLKGKDCYGMVQVDRVNGGVELAGLHTGADIRAMGDIHIDFLSESYEPVKLRSSAGISINLPFELDAEMRVKTDAHLTELTIGDRREKILHRKHVLLVGDGKRKFELDAGGKIQIVAGKIEDKEILKLFEELESLWNELGKENKARREARSGSNEPGTGADEGIDLSKEEMQAAEERVQNALKQVESRLQSMGYDTSPISHVTQSENSGHSGDLTGERMIIMRLVGEKKISLEEADKLLEALER
ncbi:MAG: hypothetical protein LLG42_12950 [Chloroflexi bacterium]|nr:hypothetical protein [Chloroflexota bacterium]